jgi:voltage-gated potassium channel
MHQLRQRPFLTLLVSLFLLLVSYPILHAAAGTRLVFVIMFTAVFLSAFRVVFAQHRHRFLALGLAIPTLVGAWSGYVYPDMEGPTLLIGLHLFAALFFSLAIGTILWAVYRQSEVTAEGICGTLCGYLLVGVVFAHLYCLIETVLPGSFHGNTDFADRLAASEYRQFLLGYFSFITLTTVGYGDITPASGAARATAIVEAVTGQFYIAVLVADLIGKRVAQALGNRQSGTPQPPHSAN